MDLKKAIERADLQLFIDRLKVIDRISPDAIVADERPDFVLTIDCRCVGLETTRSVYQEYVRGEKIHAERGPFMANTTHLRDTALRRSNDEIHASLSSITSRWKPQEEYLTDWIEKIERRLCAKRQNYNQPGFQIFAENWLLIHDSPGLSRDEPTRDGAIQRLQHLLAQPSNVQRDFDVIFVQSDRHWFRWRRPQLCYHFHAFEG